MKLIVLPVCVAVSVAVLWWLISPGAEQYQGSHHGSDDQVIAAMPGESDKVLGEGAERIFTATAVEPESVAGAGMAEVPTDKAEEYTALQARMISLQSCFHDESCDYPRSNAKQYEVAVGEDMIQLLSAAEESFADGKIQDDQLRILAHELIDMDNGYVQSKAIEVLETLPVNDDTLLLFSLAFENDIDPVFLQKSLHLLETYHQQSYAEEIDRLLQQQLAAGDYFVSQQLSANLVAFINPSNIEGYRQIAATFAPETLQYQQLHAAFNQYELDL